MSLADEIIELCKGYEEVFAGPQGRRRRQAGLARQRSAIPAAPNPNYSPAFNHAILMNGLATALAHPAAGHYQIDEHVIAAAESVASSKPSSILSALPLARLPRPYVWFETTSTSLSPVPVGTRSGVLLYNSGTDLFINNAVMTADGIGMPACWGTVLTGPVEIDCIDDYAARTRAMLRREREDHPYIKLPDREIRAIGEMSRRFLVFPYKPNGMPDLEAAARSSRRLIEAFVGGEDRWLVLSLAVLLLINSRNAVQIDTAPDRGKINKARVGRGKAPLLPLRPVTIDISRRVRAHERISGKASDADRASIRAGLISGHFKIRLPGSKGGGGGVYWWSPHVRSGALPDAPAQFRVIDSARASATGGR